MAQTKTRSPMYIRRIVLQNIRGFSDLDFDLSLRSPDYAGWIVITGDNASGKSALLRAVAMALVGPDATRSLIPSLDGWVRDGETQAEISVEIVPGSEDRFDRDAAPYENTIWSELRLKSEQRATLMEPSKRRRGSRRGPTRGPWSETAPGWFCAGYGPFRRLGGHSLDAQKLMSARGKVARFATLFSEGATLAESDIWLKELKYRELEGRADAGKTLSVVLDMLNNGFFPNGIKVDRVDSEGLWLKHADSMSLDLRDISDGFRSAAALVMDLLRQLTDVYGGEALTDAAGDVARAGVVLIDEIDAHLHPEWQRQIGGWFKRLFPKIQFIVTTHSPLICQAADKGGIFRLPAPGSADPPFRISDEDYRKVIAGKPDTILLSPAFNLEYTRSPRAVEARREYSKLEAKRRATALTEEERARHKELSLFIKEDEA
jgi:predicted ATPase